MPGVEGFLDASLTGAGLVPALRVGFHHLTRSGFDADHGSAAFQLTGAMVQICPLQLLSSESLALRPCLGGEYGILTARGSGVSNPRSDAHPWAAVGAAVRFEWVLLGPARVDASAGMGVPLVEDRFLLDSETFHEDSPVIAAFGLGLSLRLF
jgi:hypothetical protein